MNNKRTVFIVAGLLLIIGLVYMKQNVLGAENPTAINHVISLLLLVSGGGFAVLGWRIIQQEKQEAASKKKENEKGDQSVMDYMEQEQKDHRKLMN